jgi:short subunit dehydrogenase-like uncharacterized protein
MTATQVPRKFDVILYGATGFVGRQTVAYFARHPQVKALGLNWARASWWLRRMTQRPWTRWPAAPRSC